MRLLLIFSFIFLYSNDIKNEIEKFYKKHYKTIIIEKITSNKPLPKKYSYVDFRLANYKLPSITLKIDKKYYFFKIKAKIGVFKATKTIYKNDYIKPNVIFRYIPFKHIYYPPLTKINDNLIATKIISKNNIITKNNSTIRPTILKGDNVNVLFTGENIEVYTQGVALNSANENEQIKVKIGSKIFKGIVKNGKIIIK